MRRLSGMVLAGAMLMLPAFSLSGHAQEAAAQPAANKTTYNADAVIVMYAVNPGKDADYEQVLAKLRDALNKSTAPEAKQQLAGWKVIKASKPMPDGNVIYTHVISPVAGADYNILQVLYGTFTDPTEQKTLYDLYRGAFVGNLGISSGTVVADLSK